MRFPPQLKELSGRNLQATRMKYFVTVFLFALVAGIRSEYFEDLVLNDGEIPPRHPYFVGYNTVLFISSLMNAFNCLFLFFLLFALFIMQNGCCSRRTFYLQSNVKNIRPKYYRWSVNYITRMGKCLRGLSFV